MPCLYARRARRERCITAPPDPLDRPIDKALRQRAAGGDTAADACSRSAAITSTGPTSACRRCLVPIFAGERAPRHDRSRGHEREDAFGDAEVRLLQTVARAWAWRSRTPACSTRPSAMRASRRRSPTSARDLSSPLDLATVMDRIAGHAKELLRRTQRHLPARSRRQDLPRLVAVARGSRGDPRDHRAGGRRHHRQPARKRPARADQRHRRRPARRADSRHRPRATSA